MNKLSDSLHTLADDVTFPESDLVVEVGERVRRRRRRTRALLSATAGIVVVLLGFGIAAISLNRANDGGAVRSPTGQQVTCPHTFGAWESGPQRPGTQDVFVPPGPVSAAVCRYDPPKPGPGAGIAPALLTDSGSLTSAEVQQVAASLNSLPFGVMRCSMDPTSVLVLRFSYPSGPDVVVTMGIAGCWNGSNGSWKAITQHVAVPGFTAG